VSAANPDPLACRLAEAITAAQYRWRTQRGWGAFAFPAMTCQQIDALAAALAPILRMAALEAADEVIARRAAS
jgi:hypothetical protein